MNIPNAVKVGGKIYTVHKTEKLKLGCDYAAEILYSDLRINVRPSAPEKMEADFLHELVHAIFDHMGHREHDEVMVDGLAQGLHMIIKDNPGLFAEDVEPVPRGRNIHDCTMQPPWRDDKQPENAPDQEAMGAFKERVHKAVSEALETIAKGI